jgi:hypothetical protein
MSQLATTTTKSARRRPAPTPGLAQTINQSVDTLPHNVRKRGAADFLGVSTRTISRMIATGELVAFQRQPGSTSPVFVPRESIREHLLRSFL